MTQYLLLKSDGERDDPNVGLTSDSERSGGVLGGDTYTAAETSHNNYLEFASGSDYVAIDSFLQSSTITGMTVMAWVRSTDASGEAYISSHDRSEYYRFNLNDGQFDCSFDTSGGGGDHNSGEFVADGEWHHLAAVYDAGEVRMYVDGRRVYTSTGHATEIGSGGTRYGFLGAGSEAESFDGGQNANAGILDISDHRLYLDAKTDAEVEAAFQGNPPTANLHEYLPLTADDSGRLNDASGNGRHGYLRNGAAIVESGEFDSWFSFENAEDADFSDWTVNEGTLTADDQQAIGQYSMFHDGMAGVDSGETNDPRGAVKDLPFSEQVNDFSFTFWETSNNTSAALSLYNSDGQRELSFGTDNPVWNVDDADGNTSFGNPADYQHWMRFTVTFNWSESQYTIEGEDLVDGFTASHTGTLYHGKDIAEVASGQVGLGNYTGNGQWHLDQMYFNTTNDQTTPQTSSSTFNTTNTSSSSPLAGTQATSLADQDGSLTTSANVLTPENWFGDVGGFASNANILGTVDGFNEVAEFDASTNDGFEDIFTGQFTSFDWPAFFGDENYVYLAFAAKWNEIPVWGNGDPDGEWVRKPDPDPNNYQLYVLRNDANEDSRNEYFRLYYGDTNDTAYAEIADPYVWLNWGDLQWDAQIVGSPSDRTVEPTTQTLGGSTTLSTTESISSVSDALAAAAGGDGLIGSPTTDTSAEGLFPSRGEITGETINGKSVTVENDNHGKWVCVLNYEHFGGENPSVAPSSTFPQLPNGLSRVEDVNALGTSGELRHVDNITQYGSWSVDAVRLEAETSNHGRRINYYTTDQTAIDAIVDDSVQAGSAALQADFYYPDHTAALPDAGDKETQASTNRIFGYDFPIYERGEHHWALAGSGNRWEVDDRKVNETQTTVHRVWVRVDTNPEGGGGDTTITQSSSSSSTSPLAGTQDTSLTDQGGSLTTSANVLTHPLAKLVDVTGLTGDLTTSGVVEAFTESFDTIDRTGIGDALSTVTGDTVLSTAQTTQTFNNAIAEPLVAAETALFSVDDGESFGDVYADVLRASGSGLPTGAVGNTAVTTLGQAELTTTTPQFDTAQVEIFAFVSPEPTTGIPTISNGETQTNAVALTEDSVLVSVTPTTDILIQVRSGQLGVEGQFADSLAADVGASTSIKLAKTIANADSRGGTVDTSVLPDAVVETVEAIDQSSAEFANTTVNALIVAAVLQSFGSSTTDTTVDGVDAVLGGSDIDAAGLSTASPDAAVRDAVASELDASANTHVNPEALAEAAQTLTEQGLVDTETEAAALVSQVVAEDERSNEYTQTDVNSDAYSFEVTERTGRPTSLTLSDAAQAVFTTSAIDTDIVATALTLINAEHISATAARGDGETAATSVGDISNTDVSPVDALLRLLYASLTGNNDAIVETAQRIELQNTQNAVEILNK